MAFESELLKENDIVVGKAYRRELLDFYCIDFNSVLIDLSAVQNVFYSNSEDKYIVKEIINNGELVDFGTGIAKHCFKNKIIIIDKK